MTDVPAQQLSAPAPATLNGREPRALAEDLGRVPVVCGLAIVVILYWQLITTERPPDAVWVAAFVLIGAVAVRAVQVTGDVLNSLTVILGLCLLRIVLPALLLLARDDTPDLLFLDSFHMSREDLLASTHLGAVGLLAVIVGWYAAPRAAGRVTARVHGFAGRSVGEDPRLAGAALIVFAAGLLAIAVFLTINFGNPLAGFLSGDARNDTAEGTSRYSFAGLTMLVTGSTLLTLHLHRRGASRLAALVPVILATTVLTVFGGRVLAATPLVLGLLGVHYSGRARAAQGVRRRRPRRVRTAVAVALTAVAVVGYAVFVPHYRGGEGVSAASVVLSPSAAVENAETFVWTEFAILHTYVIADRLGAGEMDGESYRGFLGYLGPILGVPPTERAGTEFVTRAGQQSQSNPWGFHTGLMVDVFVNSGFAIALLAGLLFGILLRAEYDGFRRSSPAMGSIFLHCVFMWAVIWGYYESVGSIVSPLYNALPTLVLIVLISRVLPQGSRRSSSHPAAARA